MSQKVLVVEDDNNIAELLRLYLQKDGFEVSHAADGGKAVEMAKEIQPDLVLLDIMLPVMDGWQVCRELRKTMKMPIIMLTAKGETEDKVSGLEMGADDYIVKPFEVKELLARVHAVLRRTGDDGKPKSKKLTFDKLVINLDSYELIVDGKKITIYAIKDAKDCPWGELGIDVVLECTGFYTSKAKAEAHIQAGARKVVISAPAGNDLKTIVYSVNEKTLTAEDQVISAASCPTNCLAPMADTLNKTYPIVSGIMTTVHAYTGDQMILDGPQRKGDLRRARAGAQNIVPNSTGAAKAIGLVIPELNGKLIGSAQRVPVPTGSTTILVAVVKGKDVTKEAINAAMKAAVSQSFGYNEDPIVSSDVIGMKYGSLFDSTQTMVAKIDDDTYQVQVVSWYDNENSYTSQMVRTIKYFAEL